jgi:hypothetical protein
MPITKSNAFQISYKAGTVYAFNLGPLQAEDPEKDPTHPHGQGN